MGMSEAGKGHDPRPFSVDKETFTQNHEATFGKKMPWWERRDFEEYRRLLDSGMFFEFHPELTGDWNTDREVWIRIKATR